MMKNMHIKHFFSEETDLETERRKAWQYVFLITIITNAIFMHVTAIVGKS